MFHELGCCVLNRNHDNRHKILEYDPETGDNVTKECKEQDDDKNLCKGIPLSIMRWRLFSDLEIEEFYKGNEKYFWSQILNADEWIVKH